LTGFGSGSYTITPSKTGGVNGTITSFDAARIAQFVTGNTTFTGAQQTVADVSGSSGVTSFDAALIARYAASLGPPTGSAGTWIFAPVNYMHASVNGMITDDYAALLMGEVSGNWTSGAARNDVSGNGREGSIDVSAPQTVGTTGRQISIPIEVNGAANKGIISCEFDLRFDPSVIQPAADVVHLAGTVSRGLTAVANTSEPGLLRVVMYGGLPIEKDGILLNLNFVAVGESGSVTPLTWERILFNEGDFEIVTNDGQIELK
jgi:hypothetical protein